MSKLVPSSRPQMPREDVESIIKSFNIDRGDFPVCVVAVRGYYMDTMGVPGKNDRGIYDDAAFICTPSLFASVNWNTDASAVRKGSGKGAGKGMAMLDVGAWDYKIGKHKAIYPAGVQAGSVRVKRDADTPYTDEGYFGINHHPGSKVGTSSLGCQTAPPDQFASYIQPIVAELARYKKKVYKYILITEEMRKEILSSKEQVHEAPIPPTTPDVKSGHNMMAAVELIKEFEGYFEHAYRDPVGIWTIGWGTIQYPNGVKVKQGDVCTKEQATEWLLFEMNQKSAGIDSAIKIHVTDNEFCALTSFAYNCGIGAFLGSTLLKKLNAGLPTTEVATEFGKWIYAGGKVLNGLVRRRNAERDLFLRV